MSKSTRQSDTANTKLVSKLLLATVGMFCFAVFLMPPLYDVFCEITGLNGKYNTSNSSVVMERSEIFDSNAASNADVPEITIQFVADATSTVSWPFFPKTRSLHVTPGSIHQVFFRVENPKSTRIVARAIPSITPAQAIPYLKKTQCFCFNEQPLAPYEGKDLGVVFYIDPKIPEGIREVTLSYRLYDITDSVSSSGVSSNTSDTQQLPPAQRRMLRRTKGDTPNV